jgi:hypothetical protein
MASPGADSLYDDMCGAGSLNDSTRSNSSAARTFAIHAEGQSTPRLMSEDEVSSLVHNALRRARQATASSGTNSRRRTLRNFPVASRLGGSSPKYEVLVAGASKPTTPTTLSPSEMSAVERSTLPSPRLATSATHTATTTPLATSATTTNANATAMPTNAATTPMGGPKNSNRSHGSDDEMIPHTNNDVSTAPSVFSFNHPLASSLRNTAVPVSYAPSVKVKEALAHVEARANAKSPINSLSFPKSSIVNPYNKDSTVKSPRVVPPIWAEKEGSPDKYAPAVTNNSNDSEDDNVVVTDKYALYEEGLDVDSKTIPSICESTASELMLEEAMGMNRGVLNEDAPAYSNVDSKSDVDVDDVDVDGDSSEPGGAGDEDNLSEYEDSFAAHTFSSINSSDAIIKRVEEEIANARKAAQDANRRLADVSSNWEVRGTYSASETSYSVSRTRSGGPLFPDGPLQTANSGVMHVGSLLLGSPMNASAMTEASFCGEQDIHELLSISDDGGHGNRGYYGNYHGNQGDDGSYHSAIDAIGEEVDLDKPEEHKKLSPKKELDETERLRIEVVYDPETHGHDREEATPTAVVATNAEYAMSEITMKDPEDLMQEMEAEERQRENWRKTLGSDRLDEDKEVVHDHLKMTFVGYRYNEEEEEEEEEEIEEEEDEAEDENMINDEVTEIPSDEQPEPRLFEPNTTFPPSIKSNCAYEGSEEEEVPPGSRVEVVLQPWESENKDGENEASGADQNEDDVVQNDRNECPSLPQVEKSLSGDTGFNENAEQSVSGCSTYDAVSVGQATATAEEAEEKKEDHEEDRVSKAPTNDAAEAGAERQVSLATAQVVADIVLWDLGEVSSELGPSTDDDEAKTQGSSYASALEKLSKSEDSAVKTVEEVRLANAESCTINSSKSLGEASPKVSTPRRMYWFNKKEAKRKEEEVHDAKHSALMIETQDEAKIEQKIKNASTLVKESTPAAVDSRASTPKMAPRSAFVRPSSPITDQVPSPQTTDVTSCPYTTYRAPSPLTSSQTPNPQVEKCPASPQTKRAPSPQLQEYTKKAAMVENRKAHRNRAPAARAAIVDELGASESKKSVESSQSKKVRFRQRYPVPPLVAKPRPPLEIIKDSALGEPGYVLHLSKPKSDLKQLLDAVMGSSIPRRANACGALRVLAAKPKNKLTLVRTAGFLSSLVFAVDAKILLQEEDIAIDARTRAVNTLLNVVGPKDNRVLVFCHPRLPQCLVKCIVEDKSEARAAACGAFALLAKTPACREPMVKVKKLVEVLATIVKGVKDGPNFRQTDSSQYSGDDEASHQSMAKSSTSTSSSASSTSSAPSHEFEDLPQVDSIRQQKLEQIDEMAKRARLSACAAFIHLSKHCAISVRQKICVLMSCT